VNYVLRSKGVSTLATTMILLLFITLLTLFGTTYSIWQQKISANVIRHNQAFMAAETGLEYGMVYFIENSGLILANPSAGYISSYSNSNITNVTLANNSKFTVVYTNPVANAYNLILITSTGTSDDGTANVIISQLIAKGTELLNTPTTSLSLTGNVNMGGNSTIYNNSTASTILAGGSVTFSGGASTQTSAGGSSNGNFGSDVQQNIGALSSMNSTQALNQYFSVPADAIKNNIDHLFTPSNVSNASGLTNTTIWMDANTSLSGIITIGTASQPVFLFVNGNLTLSGNIKIYGFVYLMGSLVSSGNVQVYGALFINGGTTMSGAQDLIAYDPNILNLVKNIPSLSFWAKVPGSWKDF
jgi:Tfp pilus assembly protein PilX